MRDLKRPIAPTVEGMGFSVQRDHIISHLGSGASVDRNGITLERKAHLSIWLFRVAARVSVEASARIAQHERTGWYRCKRQTVPE